MRKPTRKPAVREETRRNWFERHEQNGESFIEIAKKDGYDVRTVRKQISLERQAQEGKEAKTLVLRDALEKHYADLIAFAKKLELQLGSERSMLPSLKQDRLWEALRQHLRRSVIWKKFERWEQIRNEIAQLDMDLEKRLRQQIESQLRASSPSVEPGFNERLFIVLIKHIREAAWGIRELQSLDLNKIPESIDPIVVGLIKSIFGEVVKWEPYNNLGRFSSELRRVQRTLSDELAVIIMKRVVPGKCRYCPV